MNAAAVGLIVAVAAGLLAAVRDDVPSIVIAVGALVILSLGRVGAAWLILAGAAIGFARLILGVS